MIKPMRIKFTKKELIMFGFGVLLTLGATMLMGSKDNDRNIEQCEQELDECIATMR